MKLLAKTAEDRYQTAAGLEADLRRCLAEWEAEGRIDPFPLGAHDVSDRLLIPEKLYGREAEIDTLARRLRSGRGPRRDRSSCWCRAIPASASPRWSTSCTRRWSRRAASLPSGKFDQYKRDIPYATLAQAFQSLVRQLLGKSDAELSRWRDALLEALGPNGQLMVNLIPELALIIGEQPPVPDLPPQDAQNRFQLVFRRFLGVFARPEHPLALFLDDLQWLDAATLDLLEHLVTHPEVRHLLLIGAYRDNEVGPVAPAGADAGDDPRSRRDECRRSCLRRSCLTDVGRLLADALHTEPERVRPLAGLVFEKTGGNPFFTIQFLTRAGGGGAAGVRSRHGGLDLGPAAHPRQGLHRQRGGSHGGEAEPSAACDSEGIGTAGLSGECRRDRRRSLWCTAGPRRRCTRHSGKPSAPASSCARTARYAFLHDRIQEAAYALIPEGERAMAHLRIGRLLAARTTPEELEEKHLRHREPVRPRRGADHVAGGARAGRRAQPHGGQARQGGDRLCLCPAVFCRRPRLAGGERMGAVLPAHLRSRAQLGRVRVSDRGVGVGGRTALGAVATRRRPPSTPLPSPACASISTRILDQSDSAVAVGLEYLRRVDGQWSLHATAEEVRQEYDRLWQRLGSGSIEALLDLPLMSDPDRRATMDVLTVLTSPAHVHGFESLPPRRRPDGGPQPGAWQQRRIMPRLCVAGRRPRDVLRRLPGRVPLRQAWPGSGREARARPASAPASTWSSPSTSPIGRSTCRPAATSCGAPSRRRRSRRPYLMRPTAAIDLVTNLLAAGEPLERGRARGRECASNSCRKLRFGLISDVIIAQLRLIRMLRGLTPDFHLLQ